MSARICRSQAKKATITAKTPLAHQAPFAAPKLSWKKKGAEPVARRWALIKLTVSLLLLTFLLVVWRLPPFRDAIEPRKLGRLFLTLCSDAQWAPYVGTGAFVLASSLLMIPITALILATALIFPLQTSLLIASLGSILAALLGFYLGKALDTSTVERLAKGSFQAMKARASTASVLTITTLRLMPLAPFPLVNIVAGSLGLGLPQYLIGTILGMAPGILAINYFGSKLLHALREPSVLSIAAVLALVFSFACLLLLRKIKKTRPCP